MERTTYVEGMIEHGIVSVLGHAVDVDDHDGPGATPAAMDGGAAGEPAAAEGSRTSGPADGPPPESSGAAGELCAGASDTHTGGTAETAKPARRRPVDSAAVLRDPAEDDS